MKIENVTIISTDPNAGIVVKGDNIIIEGCTIGKNENGLFFTPNLIMRQSRDKL